MANNAKNASTGKPKVGGAIFCAPANTSLPTDAISELAVAFKCLGYIGEDGVTNNDSLSVGKVKAWGGDTVLNYTDGHTDTFGAKLLEVLDINVLKAVYGEDNVSGDLSTGITVKSNAKEKPYMVWVFEMVLTDGAIKRIVIPAGKVTELGEIKYADNEAIGYEVTIGTVPDTNGNTHYEYILKA